MLDGPETVDGSAEQFAAGIYIVEYEATLAGKYNMTATVNDERIGDSPWIVEVVSTETSAEQSGVDGLSVVARAGVADSFTITARDRYGNQNVDIVGRAPGAVGAVFTISLDNAEIDMSHLGDGVYDVAYSINGRPAEYVISIMLGMNQHLDR